MRKLTFWAILATVLAAAYTGLGLYLLWARIIYLFTTPSGMITAWEHMPFNIWLAICMCVWFAPAVLWWSVIDEGF